MIVMKEEATPDEVRSVVERVEAVGARAHVIEGEVHTVIGAIGDREPVADLELEGAAGVDHLVPISRPYKLASAQVTHGERTVIDVDGRKIGGEHFATIAGPCTVESRDVLLDAAHAVKDAGAQLLRGGAYKPRTSPYSFQGLGEEGLRLLQEAKDETGHADRDRGDGRARPRRRARGGRRDPARRAQHAELHAAHRARPRGAPGADQARALRDARGAPDGGGVRAQGGQHRRDALRARHPHLRDALPLHARPDGGAGAQGADPPAGARRSQPRRGPARPGALACRWPRPRRARTGSSSRCTPIPTRRSATARSSCGPTTSPSYLRQVERWPRSRARSSPCRV